MMQLITLNHPVDCGICDKAGECTLQDYHYEYNGAPSVSRDAEGARRPSSTRCPSASCSTTSAASCARAACASRARSRSRTRSASSSAATRRWSAPAEDGALDADPYSDNVIDICPVGALLSQPFLLQGARLVPEAHAVGVPGLRARLHRRTSGTASPSGSCNALDPRQNTSIERVTPLENPAVNGPWICNKGRDLAQIFERPRADAGDAEGQAGRRSPRRSPPRGG